MAGCEHIPSDRIFHQMTNGEIWSRCLKCAKTWRDNAPMSDIMKPRAELKIYLDKYLDLASGGRCKFDYMTYGSGKFLRFHCSACTQNWNVGMDLFGRSEEHT